MAYRIDFVLLRFILHFILFRILFDLLFHIVAAGTIEFKFAEMIVVFFPYILIKFIIAFY